MPQRTERPAKPLLTMTEAAEIAQVPRSTWYRVARAAAQQHPDLLVNLPGLRLLVRREALNRWLAGTGLESAR
ncbi:MAG: hypothetical protein CL878_15425 [Dehalococcoidia bacterium]|nr:hypothetical protein [Dehalococcoidia bacterium]